MTPEGFNARSRVHEYGGGATLISGDLVVVSDFVTGRLNRVVAPEQLEALTPGARVALRRHGPRRRPRPADRGSRGPRAGDHREPRRVEQRVVSIDLATGAVPVLVDGRRLLRRAATLAGRLHAGLARVVPPEHAVGRHGAEGRAARRATGRSASARLVAGSRTDWISQPRWSPDGVLYFAAEPQGWMNLCREVDGQVETVTDFEAEFVGPDWSLRPRRRSRSWRRRHPCRGPLRRPRPAREDRPRRRPTPIDLPFTEIAGLSIDGDRSCSVPRRRIGRTPVIELGVTAPRGPAARESERPATARTCPMPEHIEFPTTGDRTAFGNFYPPDQPRRSSGRPDAPAAHRHEPRRPDRRRRSRASRLASSCSPAAATRCSTSTTAARPATARPTASGSSSSGGSSTSTTASPARIPRGAGPGRWRPARDPWRQRKRLHDARGARVPR